MKLSIITINYNNIEGLKKTVASISQQSYPNVEHLIIDGGSTDGAKNFIREHANCFSYWCCEKDKGIYNAMNKGVTRAQGEYVMFLNSGDCLAHENVLQEIAPELTGEDIIYGELIYQHPDGSLQTETYPKNLDITFFFEKSLPHPSTFIRRERLKECPYDEELKIVSDWKFWIQQIVLQQASYKHIARPISIFQMGGVSSNLDNCNRERTFVLRQLFPGMLYPTLQTWCEWQQQPIYPIVKRLMSLNRRMQRHIKPLLKLILKFT